MKYKVEVITALILAAVLTVCVIVCQDKNEPQLVSGTNCPPANPVGIESLEHIAEDVWYDRRNYNVYMWAGPEMYKKYGVTPEPYLGDNGLVMKYDTLLGCYFDQEIECSEPCCQQEESE